MSIEKKVKDLEERILKIEEKLRVQCNVIDTLLSFANKLDDRLSILRKEVKEIKKASEVKG